MRSRLVFVFCLIALSFNIAAAHTQARTVKVVRPTATPITRLWVINASIEKWAEPNVSDSTEAVVCFESWRGVWQVNQSCTEALSGNAFSDVERPLIFRTRGGARWRLGQCDGAIDDLTTALALNPEDPLALNLRGLAYDDKHQYREAARDFEAALKIEPDEAVYWRNVVSSYLSLERFAAAERAAQQAMALEPDSAASFNSGGRVRRQQGDYAGAIQDFTEATRHDPASSAYFANRGIAYLLQSQFTQAMADLNKALALDPRNANALFARGVTRLRSGEKDAGGDTFAAARIRADIEVEMRRWRVTIPK